MKIGQNDFPDYLNGIKFTENYYPVEESVSLRVLYFPPGVTTENIPVVIIGGLATILESLKEIIKELVRDFPVYYLETREKQSSRITGKPGFGIETMGKDIACIVQKLGLKENRYVLLGYSFGATAIADAFRFLKTKPLCLIFMEPTPVFHYPAWSIYVIRWMGIPLYKILIPLAKWYLTNFRINKKEDFEMAVISARALDHADPRKLRNSVPAIAGYEVWNKLELIDCPSMVVATTRDHLHIKEETDRMVKMLKNCTYADLETNLRTHSPEMGEVVRKFVHAQNTGSR